MIKMPRLILLFWATLLTFTSMAQEKPVRIVDARTGQPVAFAHVKANAIGTKQELFFLTDFDGFIRVPLTKPTVFQVTYVGYQSLTDTLQPDEEAVIRLLPGVFSLDELVVTAQYNPGSADRSLYRVNVINQMQIKRRAATDLAGLLRNQMNIRLSEDASLGTGMSLQGLSGEHVKILVDGVPVIGRLNGSIDLSQVNLQQAQQVEIIEGPMSVIYGSNALAGVVNIIPRDISGNSFSANASSYYETVGVYNFDGGFSLRRGVHSFGLQAGRNFFDGFSPIDNGRALQWKPRRQFNADANYNLSLKKINLKTRLSVFDEILRNQGNLLPPYFEKARDNYFTTDRFTAKVDLSTKNANPFNTSTSFSLYRRVRTLYYNDLSIPKKSPVEHDTTSFGAVMSRGMYSFRTTSGKFGYQAGYDLNAEWATGARIGEDNHAITDVAGFFSMQYLPWEWLSLQPGARYAYNSQFSTPIIYAAHIKAGPYKGMNLRASYSSGFRAPSLKELYLYFVDVNHNIIGNPDLRPEYSKHLQIQATHKIEKVSYATETEVRFFVNNIDDIISLVEVEKGSYSYVNVDHMRTMGYSLGIRSSLYPVLDLRLAWGRTGYFNQLGTSTSNKLAWSPEVTTEISGRWDKFDLSVTAFYKFTGKRSYLFLDENENIAEGKVSDYHNLDMSVMKSLFNDRFTITAGARNLFDITNITTSGTSGDGGVHSGGGSSVPIAWGRTWFIKLTYSISKNENTNQGN